MSCSTIENYRVCISRLNESFERNWYFSTISTMILDNTCVIFQCMKLLHVSFRISKIIKLSWCKYMKILPGFLHNWAVRTRVFCCDSAEQKMSDNYCTSNIRLNSRSSNALYHVYMIKYHDESTYCAYIALY